MFDLSKLKKEIVQRNLEILKQVVREAHPELDVERGAFHDIVLFYSAIFAAINQQRISEVLQTFSLKDLLANPENADSMLVDLIAGNWLLTRKDGSRANGQITFILSRQTSLSVPQNTLFAANGVDFNVENMYTSRSNSIDSATERKLVRTHEGWTFTIPVVARSIGQNGNIKKNTKFSTNLLSRDVKAIYAAEDFGGGSDTESNTQLLGRLQQGWKL